jgi:hypothetical protein
MIDKIPMMMLARIAINKPCEYASKAKKTIRIPMVAIVCKKR